MKQTCVNILVILLSMIVVSGARASSRDFTYQSKGNRDPFMSLVTKDGRILPGARVVSETGDVELEGIIWDPKGKSMAIINGKLVKEQQRVMNMQVLKIKKDSIILQKGGNVIVINLTKERGTSDGKY
ncbi:MAG: hypothetical protein KAS13_00490 [Candidatus Omnitrophica bacterium]|nr:hypothetical protein [Candidatus Omnitrophota bacterium]